jgi:hypothetical protein
MPQKSIKCCPSSRETLFFPDQSTGNEPGGRYSGFQIQSLLGRNRFIVILRFPDNEGLLAIRVLIRILGLKKIRKIFREKDPVFHKIFFLGPKKLKPHPEFFRKCCVPAS